MGLSLMGKKNKAVASEILRQAKALYERDYLYRYQGMHLKYFWHIIMPCLPLFLYNFLNFIGVFGESTGEIPRAITISVGITFYTLFSESLIKVSGALVGNKNFIIKTGIGFRSCYLSALFSVYSNFLIRFFVLVIILAFYDGYLGSSILLAFFYSSIPVTIGTSFGLFLSIFSVFYRDIDNIVQTFAFYLLFASGVFATIDGTSMLENIVSNLPSYVAVVNARAVIIDGLEFDLTRTLVWLIGCLLIAFGAIFAIRNSKHMILNYLK